MEAKSHAKERPPSAAARWVSCPASTVVAQLYPNDESDASLKGDYAHYWLETCILFGIMEPATEDEDVNENLANCMEWITATRASYGPECKIYAEQSYDIPETGEFGTADVTFVSPTMLHIADYKNGYVLVEVERNMQMLCYLLGAIAKYGERDEYAISVLQPNGSHIDGPFRTYSVSNEDIQEFRRKIAYSIDNSHLFQAGPHCKKTYCPHRGNCATFLEYAQTACADAWYPADVNAMSDEQLAKALDHADVLQGLRDELRRAAMTRIMQMDRRIDGYKCVKGRQNREFKNAEAVEQICKDVLKVDESALYTRTFVSVKGVEDAVKAWTRKHGLGRGKWQQVWENHIAPYVLENAGGLTLERATDARPAHRRGSEFGPLNLVNSNEQSGKVLTL
jgi:hypothetical protein